MKHDELAQAITQQLTVEVIEGLNLFSAYNAPQILQTEHDCIHAGPHPDIITDDDLDILESLGWAISEHMEHFVKSVRNKELYKSHPR